jgi:hypothetical protein
MNDQKDADGNLFSLKLAKGQVQSSLARPFVDFIVNELNLTKMMAHLDSW